jgi:hypothetical protein
VVPEQIVMFEITLQFVHVHLDSLVIQGRMGSVDGPETHPFTTFPQSRGIKGARDPAALPMMVNLHTT